MKKKIKRTLKKVKNFTMDHSEEIVIVALGLACYFGTYYSGYSAGRRAMEKKIAREAIKIRFE